MKHKDISRRSFLTDASTGAGMGVMGMTGLNYPITVPTAKENRLPREVWVASTSLFGLHPESTIEGRIRRMIARVERVLPYQPDIICLPETFQTAWVDEDKPLRESAEEVPGPIVTRFADIAKKNGCYIICPIATKENGRFYNSAILIDRKGKVAGIFHKVHPTKGELENGITPGTVKSPVFQTDFGKIGIQICYDLNWQDGWKSLKQGGAELVFFPSMFPGGKVLDAYAWIYHYYIVASTGRDARILDIGGDVIAKSGQFSGWVWAPVNMEKVFVHIWPHVLKFAEIEAQFGRKIHITILHPEDTATIESRDPEVKVMDVLKEFEIPTYDEHIAEADGMQKSKRL